jgi:hypothetical protein
MLDLERSAYGCDYGNTRGTTRVEAERIARLLELRLPRSCLTWGHGMPACADALAQVFGPDEFAERMKRQQGTIAALDAGFVRRELFVADSRRNACIP